MSFREAELSRENEKLKMEVAALREKVEVQDEEIFQLKEIVTASDETQQLARIGISGQKAFVLALLMKRAPRVVAHSAILAALEYSEHHKEFEQEGGDHEKLGVVFIHHLRKKLKQLDVKVTTHWGVGYSITAVDADRLRAAIDNAAVAK